MKKGPLAALLLIVSSVVSLTSYLWMASTHGNQPFPFVLFLAGFAVWMLGSVLLAEEWGLGSGWGFIGLLGLAGIVIMYYNRPQSRQPDPEPAERKAAPRFDY
jgi:hypothetical protein